ncbi:MFS transporter [Micromonospora sp. DT229]|uniref:MFS transporter n=1 Tax=Micromonospora sp. DT229 TaxID=3393430 RepID=UPI003CF42BC9
MTAVDAPPVATGGDRRSFRLLLTSTSISGLGDGVRFAALPLLAASISRDPLLVAAVTVAGQLPWVIVGPVTGVLTDRLDRWRLLWQVAAVQAVIMAVFTALAGVGAAGIAVIMVAAFVMTSAETLSTNVAAAVVPDLVGRRDLPRANSWLQGAQFVTSDLVGLGLGAILFSVAHLLPFVLDAVTFVVAAVLLLLVRPPNGLRVTPTAPVTVASVRADIVEGLRWLGRHRLLRTLCVLLALANFAVVGVMSIAVLYALEVLGVGAPVYGLLMMIVALGGVLGLLAAAPLTARLGMARTVQLTFAITPLPFLVTGLTTQPLVAAAAFFFVGAGISMGNVVTVSLRQRVVPRELFGRVNSSFRLVALGLGPLGGAFAGVLASVTNLRAPFLLGAAVFVVVAVVAWLVVTPAAVAAAEAEAGVDDGDQDTTAGPDQAPFDGDPTAGLPAGGPLARTCLAVVAALLVVGGLGAALPLRPDAPRSVEAAPEVFAAARTEVDIQRIARAPHPTGSAANAEVRDHLTSRLTELGLTPRVHTADVARAFDGRTHLGATLTNVSATIPGSDPTGTVLLVCHYDSVPIGPGGSDNAANVAAALEIARALRAGTPPRNDVELLFTDAEEPGLLGAQAHVDSGAIRDPARTVVVNLEARGTSGPAVMFQTTGGSTRLLPAIAASGALATSLSEEVYRLLPHDTDLTVFGEQDVAGLNFAFVGGSAHYHTAHDDPAHVDAGSVQDMGDAALAAVRTLAAADLNASVDRGDGTYFSLFGALASYPGWLGSLLAAVALLAFGTLMVLGRRRGLRTRRVLRAAGLLWLPAVGATALGFLVWYVLGVVRPEYSQFTTGDPYDPRWFVAGELLLTLCAVVFWHHRLRRRCTGPEVAVGVLLWYAMLAVLTAFLAPGASYLFVWPALVGTAAVGGALRWAPPGSAWHAAAGTTTGVAATALLLPVLVLLFPTLGVAFAGPALLLVVLLGAAAVPVLDGLRRRTPPAAAASRPAAARSALVAAGAALALAGPALIVVGAASTRYDAARPRPVSLGYGFDADRGVAAWISDAPVADPAIASVLTGGRENLSVPFPNLPSRQYLVGEAPSAVADLVPVVEGEAGPSDAEVREVRLVVRVPGGADSVALYADTSGHEVLAARVQGRPLSGGRNRPYAEGPWGWGLGYTAPPADGLRVELRVRGAGPVRIRVVAQRAGLPSAAPPLPSSASFTAYPSVAGQSFAVRTVTV